MLSIQVEGNTLALLSSDFGAIHKAGRRISREFLNGALRKNSTAKEDIESLFFGKTKDGARVRLVAVDLWRLRIRMRFGVLIAMGRLHAAENLRTQNQAGADLGFPG
jgi:hypothetical protein